MRTKFFKCLQDYKYIKKGDIIVESSYWWNRVVVLATPTKGTKVFTEKRRLNYVEFLQEEFFEKLFVEDILYLKPHFNNRLKLDFNIACNKEFLESLPKYACRSCGQKLEDKYYNEFALKKMDENKGSIVTCKSCNTKKIMVFPKHCFSLDISHPNLFDTLSFKKTWIEEQEEIVVEKQNKLFASAVLSGERTKI